ncbi:PAS domain-containing protein [Spirosoma sp. SC4-14]|uniref:PAS domain-containing sensor histidine kinase n=1 Tax=Spirosoma sp. SC4-14 TaxID=3128900 RepID=UPI0030D160D4
MKVDLSNQLPNPLLESVFQNSLNGIVLCQAIRNTQNEIVDFRIVRCNERAAAMSGLSQEQMLSRTMLELDLHGSCSGIFYQYKEVVETGLPAHVEHYLKPADRWMTQSLACYDDSVLASWTDITDQKRIELERQQETELLQAILDNTQTGIAVMQSVRDDYGKVVDFRFTHINTNAERITKRPKADVIGLLYSETWPGAQTNGVLDWHIQVAETNEPARINSVNLPVDGYNGWYTIWIRPLGDGVIATFVDITALKRAELANQQQAELLRSVLDCSSSAIIAFSAIREEKSGKVIDFRYVAQNEANRQNPGRTDEQVIGHTMLEHFPHVIQTGLFDRYIQVLETGVPARFEQEYNHDLMTGWYEISVVKWDDGIVLTLVNITEKKKHQQQLELANRELQQANDNLRQFAYVASHDLQEPLRKIMAFGDILRDQFTAQLNDYGKDIITRMQSAAVRMSALIKDVSAYSKISTHRVPFQPVLLEEVLSDIQAELVPEMEKAGAKLLIESLPIVLGDFVQLRQLFSNLLINSLKFRPTDRPVRIQIKSQTVAGAEGPDELKPARFYHKIAVIDNGIGFEEKYSEQIFQVFQRLHNRQQYEGTGVGLAICRRVAENHHGAITATGRLGQGAIFTVYLPV